MSTTLRRLVAATALTATTLLLAPTAGVAQTTEEPSGTDIPVRVERACQRIPNLVIRTDNVIERIGGDADTRGSLLWLDDRITRAADNGRTELVEVLENRRAVREASLDVFEQRRGELDDLAQRCADAGVDR
ncbi:MAG: hypothetical protein AAGA93_02690 [Actinomycetota bacterium]